MASYSRGRCNAWRLALAVAAAAALVLPGDAATDGGTRVSEEPRMLRAMRPQHPQQHAIASAGADDGVALRGLRRDLTAVDEYEVGAPGLRRESRALLRSKKSRRSGGKGKRSGKGKKKGKSKRSGKVNGTGKADAVCMAQTISITTMAKSKPADLHAKASTPPSPGRYWQLLKRGR